MSKSFYLTTTLPYVNANPHIGFALELVQADAVVRARALAGDEVFFNTGTDEHGLKIWRQAEAAGQPTQAYVDQYAARFKALASALTIWPELNFIRTTDPHHVAAAQAFWRRCAAAGDIYKKAYQVKYCVGCELEKTDSELENGRCPLHSNLELELIEEENYFFRFSRYQAPLLELYARRPDFVVPAERQHEIKSFVERGLADFSISRLASKMPWGVAVPDDESQVMYVWFDALVNYLSALGWPEANAKFKDCWPGVQVAGKDNLRQQAAMWQAMLLSAGLPASKQIYIHGFITSGGQKMSKSLGNVIDPLELARDYGAEVVRYYLLRHVHPFEDSDVTAEKFKEAYNAHLANGLGNLVSRIMKMVVSYKVAVEPAKFDASADLELVREPLARFEFNKALDLVWAEIGKLDSLIQETEPFKMIKTEPGRARGLVADLARGLRQVGFLLQPFLPNTAAAIVEAVNTRTLPPTLFPRKE